MNIHETGSSSRWDGDEFLIFVYKKISIVEKKKVLSARYWSGILECDACVMRWSCIFIFIRVSKQPGLNWMLFMVMQDKFSNRTAGGRLCIMTSPKKNERERERERERKKERAFGIFWKERENIINLRPPLFFSIWTRDSVNVLSCQRVAFKWTTHAHVAQHSTAVVGLDLRASIRFKSLIRTRDLGQAQSPRLLFRAQASLRCAV